MTIFSSGENGDEVRNFKEKVRIVEMMIKKMVTANKLQKSKYRCRRRRILEIYANQKSES